MRGTFLFKRVHEFSMVLDVFAVRCVGGLWRTERYLCCIVPRVSSLMYVFKCRVSAKKRFSKYLLSILSFPSMSLPEAINQPSFAMAFKN